MPRFSTMAPYSGWSAAALMLASFAAHGAEPTRAPAVAAPAATATVRARKPPATSQVPRADRPTPPAQPPRLDLRLGDLRRFFTPAELQSPLPQTFGDEVVVEGRHLPDVDRAPVPVGLVAPFWAVAHPFSAWRVFLPDPNAAPAAPPSPVPSVGPPRLQ